MQQERATPTMKDVAREVGVALRTVSKVFNHIPVGESYRLRVLEAAERLGYQVSSYARGMKASRTHTADLVLPGLVTPSFSQLAQEVCFALARWGYRMLLSVTGSDPTSGQACIRMAQQNQVDGVIAITCNPALEVGARVPFVSIDRYFSPLIPCVSSDNFGGGQLAAERLIALSRRGTSPSASTFGSTSPAVCRILTASSAAPTAWPARC